MQLAVPFYHTYKERRRARFQLSALFPKADPKATLSGLTCRRKFCFLTWLAQTWLQLKRDERAPGWVPTQGGWNPVPDFPGAERRA
jgi:hypothetical protein